MGHLLDLIGLITSIVLSAMLPSIVIDTTYTSLTSTRLEPPLVATAVLGCVWSLRSLTAHERQNVSNIGPVPPLTAAGVGALGVPAAVVVHSVLGRQEAR
jgi:hypothetical protein